MPMTGVISGVVTWYDWTIMVSQFSSFLSYKLETAGLD